jgi:hypothetical protein
MPETFPHSFFEWVFRIYAKTSYLEKLHFIHLEQGTMRIVMAPQIMFALQYNFRETYLLLRELMLFIHTNKHTNEVKSHLQGRSMKKQIYCFELENNCVVVAISLASEMRLN